MSDIKQLLPYFNSYNQHNEIVRWDVVTMSWCIDFGGRQCQLECQRNLGDGKFPTKTFIIYPLKSEFTQHSSKECGDYTPLPNEPLFDMIMDMFIAFDEIKDPAFVISR